MYVQYVWITVCEFDLASDKVCVDRGSAVMGSQIHLPTDMLHNTVVALNV